MSWDKKQSDPKTFLTKGQRVKAYILSIEPDTRKLSLSLKRLTESPWNLLKEKYTVGTVVDGTVKNIYEFGVSVELEPNLEGYIKQNDFSWTNIPNSVILETVPVITEPTEYFSLICDQGLSVSCFIPR